ncbi:hypothetical protein PG988_006277 [Apiospora saccharicola]
MMTTTTWHTLYTPLDLSKQVTRLLCITPQALATGNSPEFRLQHALLDTKPQYETISYCWGDPTPCRTVLIDGKELQLPRSSAGIIEHISATSDQARVIWIDAVCVNQADTKERGHQVALMTRIYSEACQNNIYLGEGDTASLKGLETIRALSVEIHRRYPAHASDLQTPIDEGAVSAFFSLPWFSRVWVVQEAVLARRSVCTLGQTQIDFDDVTRATDCLFDLSIINQVTKFDGLIKAYVVFMIRRLRDWIAQGILIDLNHALLTTLLSKCSDWRDKVFGVLGLCSGSIARFGASDLLAVDYTKPYNHVARDATRHAVMTTHFGADAFLRLPCIIRCIFHHSLSNLHNSDLPSWVPRTLRKVDFDVDGHALEVWGVNEVATYQTMVGELKDPNTLELRGNVVGKVAQVSPLFEPTMFTDNLARLRGQLTTIQAMAKQGRAYYQLGRILIGDTNYKEKRSTKEDRAGLGHMLDCMVSMPGRLTSGRSDITAATEGADSEISGVRYFKALVQACRSRRFILTDRGDLGLAPRLSRVGDTIAGLSVDHGGVPYALHYNESDDSFKLVGACYIDGHMPGRLDEAIRGSESDIHYEWFKIT